MGQTIRAVDGVSLDIEKGETLVIVGESGSGKTSLIHSVLLLLQSPGRVVSGTIEFEGRDILKMAEAELDSLRGKEISMIPEAPSLSLNPVQKVGDQVDEAVYLHEAHPKAANVIARSLKLMRDVLLPNPSRTKEEYPETYSLGMKQRATIALAFANRPKLVVADDPVASLDAIIQADILDLIKQMREKDDSSLLLTTHDLGVAAEVADRIGVMYAGRIVEIADAASIFREPKHPYTYSLVKSYKSMLEGRPRLHELPGEPPDPANFPPGCRFHPRCPYRRGRCESEMPELYAIPRDGSVACLLYPDERPMFEPI